MTDQDLEKQLKEMEKKSGKSAWHPGIDISGNYQQYTEQIKQYDHFKLSSQKQKEIAEDIAFQNQLQHSLDEEQFREYASSLLEREVSLDRLENKEYYKYDQDLFKEQDEQLVKQRESMFKAELERERLLDQEKEIVLTPEQMHQINQLATQFYQEELEKDQQERENYEKQLKSRQAGDQDKTEEQLEQEMHTELEEEAIQAHIAFMEQKALERQEYSLDTHLQHTSQLYEEYLNKQGRSSWNILITNTLDIYKQVDKVPDDLKILFLLEDREEEDSQAGQVEVYAPSGHQIGIHTLEGRTQQLTIDTKLPGEYHLHITNLLSQQLKVRIVCYSKRNDMLTISRNQLIAEGSSVTQTMVDWQQHQVEAKQATSLQMEVVLQSMYSVQNLLQAVNDLQSVSYYQFNHHLHQYEQVFHYYKLVIIIEILIFLIIAFWEIYTITKSLNIKQKDN